MCEKMCEKGVNIYETYCVCIPLNHTNTEFLKEFLKDLKELFKFLKGFLKDLKEILKFLKEDLKGLYRSTEANSYKKGSRELEPNFYKAFPSIICLRNRNTSIDNEI